MIELDRVETEPNAPGLGLTSYELNHEVVSCEQAAVAKGIPLANELKTILVHTTRGLHAVHVRGDARVSLRAVKRALNCQEAYAASPDQLSALGLQPGTVCPVLNPVWSLPHLISRTVLALDFVSTNDGSLSRYFRFSPNLLLGARHIVQGNFER